VRQKAIEYILAIGCMTIMLVLSRKDVNVLKEIPPQGSELIIESVQSVKFNNPIVFLLLVSK